jgi:hypothetical protein
VADGDPDSGYDPDVYFREVVRGLRDHPEALPADLRRRYAIPDTPAAPELAEHLRLVIADWSARVEETREGAVYASLLRAHDKLCADPGVALADPKWWADYRPPPGDGQEPRLPADLPAAAPLPSIGLPPSAPAPEPHAADPLPPDPRPPEPRPPEPVPLQAGPPPTSAEPAHPDLRPSARRVGDEVEFRWTWPSWGTEADVVWDGRRVRVSRHEYKQRGCWRRAVGDGDVEVLVAVRGVGGETLRGTVQVACRRQEVHYTVRRLWWRPGSRVYRVTFTTDQPPLPWCMVEVGYSTAQVLPPAAKDLTKLAEPTPIASDSVHLTVTVPRSARWLRCFQTDGASADLVDPDIDRLRVRSWPW